MAATKRRTTKKTTDRRSTRAPARSSSTQGLLDTGTKAVKARPKTSAAVAAGLITGIAAGLAGFFAFKRSGKNWDQFSGDIKSDVKERATTAKARIKDGIEEAKTKAEEIVERYRDGIDEDKSQTMFAEEAMTLKQTGKAPKRPIDDTVATEIKTGAISY